MLNHLWDTDMSDEEDYDQDQDQDCIKSELETEAIKNMENCAVVLNQLDLRTVSISANMSEKDLISMGIYPCSVKIQHLT